ncbi:hypothetical protein CKAH01_04893 [Colletotrichum kahawae]|uniref:Uncharacterized protein n=1 Tax=Colletotrichum kahawae TaxID=34407 RepID=A0AAD9YI05_COLKA|nr:hypothetical protein CKAH01_04893 [Colletotrichum kahawae]
MVRLGHKKSRKGCSTCKQRKVKARSGSDLESRGYNSPTLVSSGASGAFLTTPSSLMADSAAEAASERWSSWTADLGLMNHFTSMTSATLPGANLHTWKDKVPKVATDYPFLMHQILAVSAFHLASLEPQK